MHSKAEQQGILKSISATVLLPNEDPTSFTIADKTKLANKSLAARVENNDTLFIYTDAKKLVIYRPSIKKVVDLLSIDPSTVQSP